MKLGDVLYMLAVLGAFVFVGFSAWQRMTGPSYSAAPGTRIANGYLLAQDGHYVGSRNALIEIVEFSDFQCEYCGLIQPNLDQVLRSYGGDVSLVYRHRPLATNQYAFDAAVSAVCADRQGLFKEYHDILFGNQAMIGAVGWESFAEIAGVADIGEFTECLSSSGGREIVERDVFVADSLRISATPTLVIGDTAVVGFISVDEISSIVALMLSRRSTP